MSKRKEIRGSLELDGLHLKELPDFLGEVDNCYGNIDLQENQLTSLKNLPKNISGYLDVSKNRITSFEGGPKYVSGRLECSNNRISSLIGMPLVSGHGSILVSANNLTSLNGLKLPKVVDVDSFRINASFNKITTLQGSNLSSIESMYSLQLQGNPLKSIEGCPPMIQSFNVSFTDLESLKGGPKIVGYLYLMGVPNFKTLDGFPQRVDVLYVDRNFAFNDDDIKDYCRVKDIRRTI